MHTNVNTTPSKIDFSLEVAVTTVLCIRPLEIIVCKFGRNPAICLREEAIFVPGTKVPYHVTFDLDLDLEHILDAR